MGRPINDITGKRFGRLTVIGMTDYRNGSGKHVWECLCDCGNITYSIGSCLLCGGKRSCGCLKPEALKSRRKKSVNNNK